MAKKPISSMQHAPKQNHLLAALPAESGVVILDVRNPDEWANSHIPDAILISLPTLHTRLDELPRDRPIVVYCARGNRSAAGAATLDAFGFDDVHALTDGIAAWEAAGLPVAR